MVKQYEHEKQILRDQLAKFKMQVEDSHTVYKRLEDRYTASIREKREVQLHCATLETQIDDLNTEIKGLKNEISLNDYKNKHRIEKIEEQRK